MLSSVDPREVLNNFDDVFNLCVRLHTTAASIGNLEGKFNAVDEFDYVVIYNGWLLAHSFMQ